MACIEPLILRAKGVGGRCVGDEPIVLLFRGLASGAGTDSSFSPAPRSRLSSTCSSPSSSAPKISLTSAPCSFSLPFGVSSPAPGVDVAPPGLGVDRGVEESWPGCAFSLPFSFSFFNTFLT